MTTDLGAIVATGGTGPWVDREPLSPFSKWGDLRTSLHAVIHSYAEISD